MMKKSAARRRADYKYMHKNYDSIYIYLAKGDKEKIRALADEQGISMSRYILEAVEQRSGLKLTLDGEFAPFKKKDQTNGRN